MRALLRELGDPQRSLRGVLVGGTNGKGSTQAMVAAMLGAGGLVVGQAPSPHLSDYAERIVVDGRPIAVGDLETLLAEVLGASTPGERAHGPSTEFELLIASAFTWFARCRVDVAVMEVGLGGRLDATNAWDGGVAAITNVSLDHQEYLGPTLESIAREKAAIIKRGDRAVTGASGSALKVIRRRARRLDVPLLVCEPLAVDGLDARGTDMWDARLGPLRVGLVGRHQAQNAAVALAIVASLADAGIARIEDDDIRRGLAGARWPGRFERLDVDGLMIVLDGAHNPDGAAALAQTFEELRPTLPHGRVTVLLGILRDKEVTGIMSALAGSASIRDGWLVATGVPDTDRSLPATVTAAAWSDVPGAGPAEAVQEADEALDRALDLSKDEGGPLLVTGSLYLVGHVRARLLAGRAHR